MLNYLKAYLCFIIILLTHISVAQDPCKCELLKLKEKKELLFNMDSLELFSLSNTLKLSNSQICHYEAYNLIAQYYNDQRISTKASLAIERQEQILNTLNCDNQIKYELYRNKAKHYIVTEDLDKLSEFAYEALKEAEHLKDPEKQIESIKNIVYLNTRMRETEKNWDYIKKSEALITNLDIDKQTIKHYRWLAFEYETQYTKTNRKTLLDSALLFINLGKKEAFKYDIYEEIAQFYRILEATSYHKGNLRNALKYIDSAIYYGKKIKGKKNLAGFYLAKSWDHLDLGEFEKATIWMDSALYYDSPKGSAANMMMYSEAAQIYEQAGQLKKAFESYRTYSKIKDSILNLERIEKINEIETKYQTEVKDAKIKRLIILLIMSFLIILVILFVFKIIQLKRTRQKNYELKLAFKKQIQLEKELSDVRDDIAQDFHDDLGNKLARISLLSNLISGEVSIDNPKIKSKVRQITEDANGLYRGTRDFIFSLKSSSNHIEEVATYLSDFGEDFFKKTKVKFVVKKNISINDKLPHYWNKQLIFIFKEALTNALKHSNCDLVTLTFIYTNHELTINCHDNGKGMSKEDLDSQNGIANMKNRAKKIDGLLVIHSEVNKGTTITFTGKTNQK